MNVRVVISIHGINTRGVWQKDLVPELALAGFIPYVLDYGNYSPIKLLRKNSLNKQVDWLVGEYDQIRKESGCERPSVIAHSFGTLQVAYLLQKYNYVIFDKVILAAGIVPLDYLWSDLLNAQRVHWVVNYFGGKDLWPKVARWFVPHAGNSGTALFKSHHRALHQIEHAHHGHSDYFSRGNFRNNWIPTLLMNKRAIVDHLSSLINHLTKITGMERNKLRCFVLQVESAMSCLKVVPGLHLGDVSQREVDLAISLDSVGPGAAPVTAFNEMLEVRQFEADIHALRVGLGSDCSLHKDLKWSIALPIPNESFEMADAVLIIDGLNRFPDSTLDKDLIQDDIIFKILNRISEILSNVV